MKDIQLITQQFNNAQEFNNELSDYLDTNMMFGSKTPKEWKKEFFIELPENIDFENVIQISAELFTKYQRASYLRDKETMQLTILEQSRIDKYNTAYNNVRTEHEEKFNKGLAAESCKIAANLAVKDLEDAISNQKVAKDFWKSMCDTLVELRKLVDMMGYALANDARIGRELNIYGARNEK